MDHHCSPPKVLLNVTLSRLLQPHIILSTAHSQGTELLREVHMITAICYCTLLSMPNSRPKRSTPSQAVPFPGRQVSREKCPLNGKKYPEKALSLTSLPCVTLSIAGQVFKSPALLAVSMNADSSQIQAQQSWIKTSAQRPTPRASLRVLRFGSS